MFSAKPCLGRWFIGINMINYGYFRHRFDAHTNTKLNNLVDDVGVVGFAYYYLLLEIYGAYISRSDDKNSAQIHQRVLANTWRKRVDSCHLVITKLQLSGLLVFTLTDSIYTIGIPNYLKYFGSYKKTDTEKTPNKKKRKEIKRKENKTKESDKSDEIVFDFESIYNAYPRKEGKTNGFKKLTSEIKSVDDYNSLKEAVSNYAEQVSGQDKKYIKLFSSFTSVWRDYIEVEEFGDPVEIARRKFCEEAEAAEAEMLKKWPSAIDLIKAKHEARKNGVEFVL